MSFTEEDIKKLNEFKKIGDIYGLIGCKLNSSHYKEWKARITQARVLIGQSKFKVNEKQRKINEIAEILFSEELHYEYLKYYHLIDKFTGNWEVKLNVI